jgi:outer membrane lipoprotein-sorting protein
MKNSSRNHSRFSPQFLIPVSLGLMVLMAVAAVAAPPPAKAKPLAPELQVVIDRFDGAQARIQRISAIFKEVKTLALLKEPLVQSGRFFHTKPDKFLWEYTKPEPKTRILNGKSTITYFPLEKRAEEFKTRFSKRFVKYLGLGTTLRDLVDEFEVELVTKHDIAGTDLLVLVPKKRQIKKRISEIRIWLDQKVSHPRRILVTEADGDKTVITFDDLVVNPEISLSRYEMSFPDDVRVTRQFSGFFSESSR